MRHLLIAMREGVVEHRRALLLLAALLLALVTVVQIVSYFAASRSATCAACHIMEPYVEIWTTSPHRDVACVTCHSEWRFILSATYLRYAIGAFNTQLRAEVPDKRCLACHEHQELDTDRQFLKNIHFSHEGHLGEMRRGKKLHCTACHNGHHTIGGCIPAGPDAVDRSVCFTCHFKGAEEGRSATGCLVCHGPPTTVVTHQGFTFDHQAYLQREARCEMCHVSVTAGDANVPRERCSTCHVSHIEAYEDTIRVHSIHLRDHEIDCTRCHNRMEHGKVAMAPALGERCDACHRPTHTPQEQMYIGIGGDGVTDSPSTMFLARVACDSCHGEPGSDPRHGAEQLRRSCVTCHGEGYDRMVDDWIRELGVLVVDVTAVVHSAETQARAQGARGRVFERQLQRARHNLDFVRRAHGEHNIHYAVELLRAARSDAAEVLERSGISVPRPPLVLASESGYCRVCHSTSHLGTRLPFNGMEYDHNRHIRAGLDCATCHSLEEHGETVIRSDQCMACHHGSDQRRSCETCHRDQASLYRDGVLAGSSVRGDPDAMAAVEVGCTDCHDPSSSEPLVRAVQQSCTNCHEEGYDEMLIEWINEDQERVQNLAILVARARRQLAQEPAGVAAPHRRSLAEAERIYQGLVRVKGVHNPALAADAAARASTLLAWVTPAP